MTLFRCREACPRLASAYVRTRRLFPANLSSACLSQHLVPPRCFIPPSSSSCRTSSTPSSTPPRTTWKPQTSRARPARRHSVRLRYPAVASTISSCRIDLTRLQPSISPLPPCRIRFTSSQRLCPLPASRTLPATPAGPWTLFCATFVRGPTRLYRARKVKCNQLPGQDKVRRLCPSAARTFASSFVQCQVIHLSCSLFLVCTLLTAYVVIALPIQELPMHVSRTLFRPGVNYSNGPRCSL